MTLDDLMEVWRSQDASPLHGVNETLLRLALRQDEAKLQARLRWGRWVHYASIAFVATAMALFLAQMIYPYDDDVLTGWDYAIPVVGLAAAVLWAGTIYVRQRERVLREQRFGASLRDQVNRQLMQLDYLAIGQLTGVLRYALPAMVCALAMILASWRVNDRAFSDETLWMPLAGIFAWFAICLIFDLWWQRRALARDVLPRKRRLEALLKEFDGQK